MKSCADILKSKGIVATPQRIAVWNSIKDSRNHPCADIVYESVKRKFPTISLATVYSILETLKDASLLLELFIRKNKSCFDSCLDIHHHLLCKKCNKIYDIDIECKVEKIKELNGHKIESVHGYFYGICNKCIKGGDRG